MLHPHRILTVAVIATLWLVGCRTPEAESREATNETTAEQNRPTEVTPETLATGRFADKGGQTTSGAYRIERRNGDLQLVLAGDFETNDGPDLHVVLSPNAPDAVTGQNAMAEGEAMVVASLTSLSGQQHFDLPDDADLTTFKSVLIHCIQYSHLYGAAPL